VLGVGDREFFIKCLDRIMQFRRDGKTILCVSHSLQTLQDLCTRAIWLDHGRLVETGPVKQVIAAYIEQTAPVGAT
jgi:ABC-type polysaccharide/polyol phosphate transport system ATPase subunit